MERRYIKCTCCDKRIYEGDSCLEHEYGNVYCSYKCLVVHGFYGHYKSYALNESKINDEEYETAMNF